MKRSKKILFSLGAVLPLAGGVLLTSCAEAMSRTKYNFAADSDFRKAAFGNIGTINQVKNVVENSLQLPKTAPTVTMAPAAGAAGSEAAGAEASTGTGNTGGTGTAAAGGSGSSGSSASSSAGSGSQGGETTSTGSGGSSSNTSGQSGSAQANTAGGSGASSSNSGSQSSSTQGSAAAGTAASGSTSETAMMTMLSGAWKHFDAIVKAKMNSEKTTAEMGLMKFYTDFKAKFDEVLKFEGSKNLRDGTASLEDLRTGKTDLETKAKALFTVYNALGTALGQSKTFDTTKKSFEELAEANQGLSTLYKLMNVDVYNFAKPIEGNSYNDLARFFEALNGFLGGQFAMNTTTSNVFQLFGNITALLISRELRIIDGAINSVLLTTPSTNREGLETLLLTNVNKNSTIKQRYDETVKALNDVKAQTDQWANSPIVTKTNNQQSKLEMAAAKANETSKPVLTRLVNALYGNSANMPGFAVKGLFRSVNDLKTQLDAVKTLVSANYTSLSDFINVYKMTNTTWMEGVGIFVNSQALNGLNDTEIDKLTAATNVSDAADTALFTEVKTELKRLVAATTSLPKNGAGQDKRSAFYLNQMVRSITSDNQARLASMGEGAQEFSFYVNTAL
ncbi:hypothetical protein [Mycoplasmoides gallisepticum]|uniref:hypothetical protein n=1 Tax=Mycoplasmoides gallisepticum TaxID=2096 RepID=UPI0012451A18|nr:hypothetical protein [Mycoplasmoides gallisepticum]QEX46070.1 hypothetical protein F6J65_03000 [Mycoplasmoides gallisepticum]